ncbi:hypothetical protein BCR34DRAFT_341023 [Clohesyomyces aquaticus]|uniref:FAD-binding PCMH-type domain-containing protein n=1 Tax=Clohesyomyces aquaticus TaxID=1231657 RepID=A0A1Y1ZKQ4_9PLEO|nr:hypothetical protein BCR34DRAFT_341023 [Clohesyomyces aquaticus]
MFELFPASTTTTFLIILISIFIMRRARASRNIRPEETEVTVESPTEFTKKLASALPHSVILPRDTTAFKQSVNAYWAQQACEMNPSCVFRPRNVQEVCSTVAILKDEYDRRREEGEEQEKERPNGLFAIRSGGHSPVSGAASIHNGVLIDLSLLCDVTPAEDGSIVAIGAGAKWKHVSQALDEKGLAVVGGRNSDVGVGGLTLGGGLSFFSPRFGLVCNNIISYEIVIASGSVITASESSNPQLWRALKGGSNNFGIVTRFTARSFPSTNIWSGFLYFPSSQSLKVLDAFHDFVSRANPSDPSKSYDDYAAGPIASFTYLQQLGIEAVAVNLAYTKLPQDPKKWPTCWSTSKFKSLWRLWSTCKVRTLTSATNELNELNPPGRRQTFATTTIKNHVGTLARTHMAYKGAIKSIRKRNVKGMSWTLVLQPFMPSWARKGDSNPLGLDRGTDEPLVNISFTVNWANQRDDEWVETTTREAIEQIELVAKVNETGHPYRYINYCGAWQRPFMGYGEENLQFLRNVSRLYDPDGLFQKGCAGGYKLGNSRMLYVQA